jgi:S1-C subfamily serine protease
MTALLFLLLTPAAIETVEAKDFSKELQTSAVCASVRVVNSTKGAKGSGTIVGRKGVFVYVLTANHVVDGAERLELALFSAANYPEPDAVVREVDVVASSKEADLAVLRFAWRKTLASVPICPPDALTDGKAWSALSIGCENGRAPTCRAERVVDRKRIRKGGELAMLAWELEQEIAAGRSGGALLDARGRLLGVASGRSDGKAYFTHVAEVHALLRRKDLAFLFEPGEETPKPGDR